MRLERCLKIVVSSSLMFTLSSVPHIRDHKRTARVLWNGKRLEVGRWFPTGSMGGSRFPRKARNGSILTRCRAPFPRGGDMPWGGPGPTMNQGPRHCRRPFTGYDPSASL